MNPLKCARRCLPAMVLVAVSAVGGCSREASLGPPPLKLGQTECSYCGMAISDDRYASGEIVTAADGAPAPRAFDDIGCMLRHEREHPEEHALARYAKDFSTRQWIAAEEAVYVQSSAIESPMGHGLLATSKGAGAEALRTRYAGTLQDLAALRTALAQPEASTARAAAPQG